MIKKIASALIAVSFVLALTACGKEENTTSTPETITSATTEESTTEVTSETTSYPTGVPVNEELYAEYSNPLTYLVIEEAIAYSDNSVQEVAMVYPVGASVTALASDGTYAMLDNGYVVLLSCLEEVAET